jgi:mannose-1-phosphate guanylyltransferase
MTNYLDHAYAVILAGGGGTRLWPKSRNKTPKQFLKLTSDQTMMQVAASRITKLIPWERVIVVTNEMYKEEVANQLPEVPKLNIISEPDKKDTAMAMLAGTLYAQSLDPQAIVVNSASDHTVRDEKEFVRVMKAAVKVASTDPVLVTVGITPTFPSSAFGYIKVGEDLEKVGTGLSLFRVVSFTEKPKESTARAFISTGKYFWNANMYVWGAQTLLNAFSHHMPSMYELSQPLMSAKGQTFHDLLPAAYDKAESISIDYAISEKASNLVLIPGDFGWDDVGNWDVVYNLGKKDESGNVIMTEHDQAQTLAISSHNNLIHANGRLVALVGVDDMLVIDTDEIVMIAPKSRSQDVKKIVEKLK